MDTKLADCEKDLVRQWTNDLIKKMKPYKEPYLDCQALKTVKRVCARLSQDAFVFFNAVDLLEKYIALKNAANEVIPDPMLAVTTVVMLSAKYEKRQYLTLHDLQKILQFETKCKYSISTIRKAELEVMKTLDTLQLQKDSDDLQTFVKMFEELYKVKVSLVPLAINTLELLYLKKNVWFFEMKEFYKKNDSLPLFESLMRTRSYIPIGILGFLLKTSNYRHCFDVEAIIKALSNDIEIHMDHITLLIARIEKIYKKK